MIRTERLIKPSGPAVARTTKVVAKNGDREQAHVTVFVDNAIRSTIVTPRFADAVDRKERTVASNCLVAECVKVAAEAGGRYIEATPSSRMPRVEDWKSALADNGFRFVAEKVVLTSTSSAGSVSRCSHFEFVPGAILPVVELQKVYTQCQYNTFDRADIDDLIDLDTNFEELLKAETGCDGISYSWAILSNGRPVGLAFLEFQESTAWVSYIGIIPDKRRQGAGTSLLSFVIGEASRQGIEVVKSLIDVDNRPSIEMFRRCGFVRAPGTYYVYRRRL